MIGSPRPEQAPWRNIYGRAIGKKLRARQKHLLEVLLPQLQLAGVGWDENPDRTPIDLSIFGEAREIWLEIGFGAGEHTHALAQANPDIALIACEPFINGVAMLLSAVDDTPVENLWLHPGDARDLFDVLPAGCLGRAYLLYPDPWPKNGHHRRRFVNAEAMEPLARALCPGAEFRVATDIDDYVRHTLAYMKDRRDFEMMAASEADRRTPWPGWTRTRYEAKALREGRTPTYLRFQRLGSDSSE